MIKLVVFQVNLLRSLPWIKIAADEVKKDVMEDVDDDDSDSDDDEVCLI